MIIICDKDKFNVTVQTALRVISTRVTMPILSGVLINSEDDRIVISSTDLEMSVRAPMEARVMESGSTVVSGRMLGDIVKSLPAGELKLESEEKYLTVKTQTGEYRIREMQAEDFPQIPVWEGESAVRISGGGFLLAVQQTSKASSSDEKRPVLTGTLIEMTDGRKLRLVTTDSYRLAWKEVDTDADVAGWEECIIPTRALNEVSRIAGSSEGDIEIKVQDRQIMFRVDDLVLTSRLIEGQFPNYRQLVPRGERTSVKFMKEEITSVLKRAMVFGHSLRFGVYSDHVRIITETPEVGASREDLPAEVSGEEMEIGFNGAYLLDGIAAAESDRVEIKMDDPQKPVLLKNEDSDNFNYILMPVRLK